jgi:hypothetical protein
MKGSARQRAALLTIAGGHGLKLAGAIGLLPSLGRLCRAAIFLGRMLDRVHARRPIQADWKQIRRAKANLHLPPSTVCSGRLTDSQQRAVNRLKEAREHLGATGYAFVRDVLTDRLFMEQAAQARAPVQVAPATPARTKDPKCVEAGRNAAATRARNAAIKSGKVAVMKVGA